MKTVKIFYNLQKMAIPFNFPFGCYQESILIIDNDGNVVKDGKQICELYETHQNFSIYISVPIIEEPTPIVGKPKVITDTINIEVIYNGALKQNSIAIKLCMEQEIKDFFISGMVRTYTEETVCDAYGSTMKFLGENKFLQRDFYGNVIELEIN